MHEEIIKCIQKKKKKLSKTLKLTRAYLVGHVDWVGHGLLDGHRDVLVNVHWVRGRHVVRHRPVYGHLDVDGIGHWDLLLDLVGRWHGHFDLTVDGDAGDVTLIVTTAVRTTEGTTEGTTAETTAVVTTAEFESVSTTVL